VEEQLLADHYDVTLLKQLHALYTFLRRNQTLTLIRTVPGCRPNKNGVQVEEQFLADHYDVTLGPFGDFLELAIQYGYGDHY
jgi:hypothetical protein